MTTALLIIAAVLTVVGLVGNLIPAVPGTPLNFIAILTLHFVRGGDVFSTWLLVVLGILTAGSVFVDYALPLVAARRFGASAWGIWGSVLGMIVGLIFFAFIGMLVGMVAGAVIGELIAGKRSRDALRAGAATLVGNALAVVLRMGLSLAMTVIFFAGLLMSAPST
jgi:uncharacterized protein YqgC (DUF456 family)